MEQVSTMSYYSIMEAVRYNWIIPNTFIFANTDSLQFTDREIYHTLILVFYYTHSI